MAVGDVEGVGCELDADGLVVAPRLVDGRTHLDAQVPSDRLDTSTFWHGVTTVAMGSSAFTLASAPKDERALVVRNLERAEGLAPSARPRG